MKKKGSKNSKITDSRTRGDALALKCNNEYADKKREAKKNAHHIHGRVSSWTIFLSLAGPR